MEHCLGGEFIIFNSVYLEFSSKIYAMPGYHFAPSSLSMLQETSETVFEIISRFFVSLYTMRVVSSLTPVAENVESYLFSPSSSRTPLARALYSDYQDKDRLPDSRDVTRNTRSIVAIPVAKNVKETFFPPSFYQESA